LISIPLLKDVAKLTDSFNSSFESNKGKPVLDQLTIQFNKLAAQAKIFREGLANVKEPAAIDSLNQGLKKTQAQMAVIKALMDTLSGTLHLESYPMMLNTACLIFPRFVARSMRSKASSLQ
jgi:hypothetical protein